MIGARTVALLAGLVLLGDLAAVTTVEERTTTASFATASSRPVATESTASESLDEQLARVLAHVEEIRGVRFPGPPTVRYESRGGLRAEVEAEIEAYTPEGAALDEALLEALGQLPVGTDLRALLVTAYGEQVAGFYDPVAAELVVGTDDPTQRVGRLDEITLAHELGHALVDAVVGLPDLDAFEEGHQDALAAAQALVEGDATAVMNRFTQEAMSPIDQMLLAREALALLDTLEAFTALPWILQRSLEFPYTEGLAFVEHLLTSDRGWQAVDLAYRAPPQTTLEILVPELYGRVEPVATSAFGRLDDATWTAERTLSFGALDLLLLLEAPGGDPSAGASDADLLARAWRGGSVRQWSTDRDVAIAVHVGHVADVELCDAVVRWYAAAFPESAGIPAPAGTRFASDGPAQDAVVACDDGEVRLGIGPDVATAARAIGN